MELKAFRQQRLNSAASAAGVDLLVASLPANISYLTNGYVSTGQFVIHRTQSYVLFVPGENRVIYVTGFAEVPGIVEHAGEDAEIFCSGSFRFAHDGDSALSRVVRNRAAASFGSAEEALAAAIQSTGRTSVALDESRITRSSWEKITNACEGISFQPGEPVFLRARMVKHPDEVAKIEKAAEIAEDSLHAVLKTFKPGMTELQLEWAYKVEVAKRGAEPYFIVATGDKRAAYSDVVNTDLVIQRLIRFDFGVIYQGYCSDIARTATIGSPDDKTRTYYEAVRQGTRQAIAAMKPGVTTGEIFDIAVRVTRENGIPHYERHHAGHGIGLEAYDVPPSVAPGVDTKLEAGMTLCIETPYYEVNWGGVQIENTVEVTATGARYLDKSGDELIIL